MSTRPCPICKKPRSDNFAPFCSARCRDRDLAQWFNEGYAVPGPPAEPDDVVQAMGEARDDEGSRS